jgi:hypothetical protein
MEYCYSTNEEDFFGKFDSREDAAAEAFSDDAEQELVFTAEIVHAKTFLDGMNSGYMAESVIEQIDEHLHENIGGDEANISLGRDAEKELGELIIAFVKEHGDFHRWGVKNVQETVRR